MTCNLKMKGECTRNGLCQLPGNGKQLNIKLAFKAIYMKQLKGECTRNGFANYLVMVNSEYQISFQGSIIESSETTYN